MSRVDSIVVSVFLFECLGLVVFTRFLGGCGLEGLCGTWSFPFLRYRRGCVVATEVAGTQDNWTFVVMYCSTEQLVRLHFLMETYSFVVCHNSMYAYSGG